MKLRELREERALSQRELARMAGTTANTISSAERGERRPNHVTVRRLAEALGVEPKELLGRERGS